MNMIGIDLGTTNSLACVWKSGQSVLIPNSFNEFLTPSVVSVAEDGSITVGKTAKQRLISHPDVTAASFKRFMGTDKKYELGAKTFTAPELSSFVLRKLREDAQRFLNEPVTEAIISVPAYFNDAQRSATKLAGSLAGLNVERIVNEPSAAALACHVQNAVKDDSIMVFDFGGGTLDVSIVDCFENIVEIVSIAGDNRLGGDDIDRLIAEQFCKQNHLSFSMLSAGEQAILISTASQCKQALSTSPQSIMLSRLPGIDGSLCLTSKMLIDLSSELLLKIKTVIQRALRDSGKPLDEISRVILVGGSCNMPIVLQYLTHLLHKPFFNLESPDKTVALGIGAYAGIKARNEEIRDVLLTDICPFTLGINVMNHADQSKGLMSPIIERNSTLPVSRTGRYYTVHDNQTTINVEVYQGEEMYAGDNLLLDAIEINVPAAPAGTEAVDVRFTYDINGLLDVDVTSVSSNVTVNRVLVSRGNQISKQEIKQKRKELAALKVRHPEQEEADFLVARAQRLFTETTGAAREMLQMKLQAFQNALSSNKKIQTHKEQLEFSEFLDTYENDLLTLED